MGLAAGSGEARGHEQPPVPLLDLIVPQHVSRGVTSAPSKLHTDVRKKLKNGLWCLFSMFSVASVIQC